MPQWFRVRAIYLAFALLIVALGLALQNSGIGIDNSVLRDFSGDALWALMMGALISATVPTASRYFRCAVALIVCFVVEFSQLLHVGVLDDARSTTIGRLILGSGFDARDLIAYSLGVLAFWTLDRSFLRGALRRTPDGAPESTY